MKKILILLFVILLVGCSLKNSFKEGYSSNINSETDKEKLAVLFKENNIESSYFLSLVNDYNKEKDKGCGINNKWIKTDKIKYNEAKCTLRYEKNHDISDGNCRITAFILIDNILNIEKEIKDYGTYLMFDMDVLDNNTMYKNVNKNKFITLFNEIVINDQNKKDVYPNKWKEYGIRIKSDDVSLISVVMEDTDLNTLFIGHTGVLIKDNNKYLFIEKIAFEMPYQITVFKTKEDLKNMLLSREEYSSLEKESLFIYENERLLYSNK